MVSSYSFPTAAHSYFRALNKKSQKRLFLRGDIEQPVFRYRDSLTSKLIKERIRVAKNNADVIDRLQLVQASIDIQRDPSELDAFRAANLAVFNAPTEKLASAILCRIEKKLTDENQKLWNEVIERVGQASFPPTSVEPSQEVFNTYRGYLKQYAKLPEVSEDIQDAFHEQLKSTNLEAEGWRLRVLEGAEHARTYHTAKTISIGNEYQPRSKLAIRRIVIHEVFGHALRGPQTSLEESEGVAILLEQLTKPSFAFRRSYRYLAVALGWGVFGKKMTFREVFEILWRLMVINSKYTQKLAKQYAFDECYRAFRGGQPSIAGAVFLKDAVYFDASMRVWEILNSTRLSYNEFVDIIEGRRTVL